MPAVSQRTFDFVNGVISCAYIHCYDAPTTNVQKFADGNLDPIGSVPGWPARSFLRR